MVERRAVMVVERGPRNPVTAHPLLEIHHPSTFIVQLLPHAIGIKPKIQRPSARKDSFWNHEPGAEHFYYNNTHRVTNYPSWVSIS